jgi:hypothetical protein
VVVVMTLAPASFFSCAESEYGVRAAWMQQTVDVSEDTPVFRTASFTRTGNAWCIQE